MKILRLAQAGAAYPKTPTIHGTDIDIFHRTNSQSVVGNVCETGFIAGCGAMYGVGIYANYSLDSCMKNYGLGAYGGLVVKGTVDLKNFVIFDYDVAEKIYGANYRLPDQITKVIGLDKIASNREDAEKILWGYHQTLKRRPRTTSNIAQSFIGTFRTSSLNGILFTGNNDGNTVVVYNASLVVPTEHAFVDQRTKSGFKWEKCPPCSRELFEAMVEASQGGDWRKVNEERTRLIKNLIDVKDRNINISKDHYPNIPDAVFDGMLISLLYEDESRWGKLSKGLKGRLKDKAPAELLLRKIYSDPLLNWDKYFEASKEIREKIDPQELKTIWQDYADSHPMQWTKIPENVRKKIDNTEVVNYFATLVNTKADNFLYVPDDLKPSVQKLTEISDSKVDKIKTKQEESDIVSEESEEFDIPISSMGWFQNEIEKLNKKAAKIGLPPIVVNVIGEDTKAYTKKVTITRNIPILKGGWKLVAKIMPYVDPETKKTITNVQNLGTHEIPEEYLGIQSTFCEHCKTQRKRNYVYLLYSTESGDYTTVGSDCLKDFVGELTSDPDKIARFAEILQNSISSFRNAANLSGKGTDKSKTLRGFKRDGIPLPYFLSRCIMVMNEHGYVTGGQAWREGGSSTGQIAYDACIKEDVDNKYYKNLSSSEIVWVDGTIDWLYGLDFTELAKRRAEGDDYLYNLVASCTNGVVKKAAKNYAASALNAYKRDVTDKGLEQNELIDAKNATIYFSGKLKEKRPLFFQISTGQTTQTGSNYCLLESDNGDLVVWGDNTDIDPNVGDTVRIQAKVVDYTSINGRSATVISDVKIIPVEEYEAQAQEQEERTARFRAADKVVPEKKRVYKTGDMVDAEFDVVQAKPTRRGNIFYQVKDEFGTSLSFFLPPPVLKQVGEKIHVKGQISISGRFINIENPEVIGVEEVQLVEEGQVLEKTFKVVDSYVNQWSKDMIVVEDENGVKFEFGTTQSTMSLNVDDYAILKGSVKQGYGGVWKLLRVKLINMAPGFDRDLQGVPADAPPADDADQPVTSKLNWYSQFKISQYI